MSELHRYLQQQRALYGDALVLDASPARPRATAQAPAPAHADAPASPRAAAISPAPAQAGDPATPSATDDALWRQASTLAELRDLICECTQCPLGQTRKKFVFGVGNPEADIVIVGEAPGADEDAQGEPFVGRAGQLLNKILEAIEIRREDVFICNILKCRPPGNRDPLPAEVAQCEPYLHKQLAVIRPKIMLALGRIAAQTLLRSTASLTTMRASTHEYQGIPLMVTYHPAALLRNPNWKRPT